MMRSKHWIIAALACLIPLAACVVSPGQPATTATEPTRAAISVAATAPRSSSEADASASESTAKVLQIVASCYGFDPAIDSSIDAMAGFGIAPVTEVFSGLTALSGNYSQPLRNELLDRYSVSADGLVYEFVLRPGLKFSDGSALTASDVKWSWERAWLMSVSGGRARDVFGSVEGAEIGPAELPGVQVVDDRTLVVTLSAPVPEFPMLLADPVAAILKRDNVAQWGAAYTNGSPPTLLLPNHIEHPEMPIGAGPFAYSEFDWLNLDECSLLRNPHYHGSPAQIDSVQVIDYLRVIENSGASTTPEELTFEEHAAAYEKAFNERDIDFMLLRTESAEEGDGQNEDSPPATTIPVERTATQIVVLNTAKTPFDDVNFRRAIAASWDLGGLFGEEQPRPPGRILPPAIADLTLDASGIPFDPSLASQYLEQSRYPLGTTLKPVTIYYPYFGSFVDWLGKVFRAWGDTVGLTVRVASPDDPDWKSPSANIDQDLAFLTINAAQPDPYGVLSAVIASVAGNHPSAEWANARDQLDAARHTTDRELRRQRYVELEQHLLDTAMVIPYATHSASGQFASVAYIHPYIHGLRIPAFPRSVLQDIWLDDTAPVR